MTRDHFLRHLDAMPLAAILRGIVPSEVESVGDTLVDAGFRIIEVPLNSPRAMRSIAKLAKRYGDSVLIGAGTVTRDTEIYAVASAGGRLIVSPHTDPAVIAATRNVRMVSIPGFMTPTEAYTAVNCGADALKLFPASAVHPALVSGLEAVLPDIPVMPVGGIGVNDMERWWRAGARGFGVGGSLYRPGDTAEDVRPRAEAMVSEMTRLRAAAA